MFSGWKKKNDKNSINSALSKSHTLTSLNKINLFSSNENDNIDLNNNSRSSYTGTTKSNDSQNNNDNNFLFDFENIEAPKEEDFGDFRVITNSNFSSKFSPENSNKKYKIDLINLIVINKKSKSKKKLPTIKSYITSIYYNINNTKDKFNMEKFKNPCYIYDTRITEIIGDLDINYSNNCFLYMSYRSGLENFMTIGCGNYTSDCGWGCMLRCCQMMLNRGLIKKELYKLYNEKKIAKNNDILELKKEVLSLFNDRFLSFKELKDNRFLSNLYEKYKEKEDVYELIPPFSIYTLCKLNNCSGIYTSDTKMIKSFIEINKQIFNNSFEIVHFESGIISKKKLYETFCVKRNLEESEEGDKSILINQTTNNSELNNINNNKINDPVDLINIFNYYGVEYQFAKGGFIFISLRLGLRDLDENYFSFIPLLFQKIHNNIGFVSGKKNKAFYFIGQNGDDKLIYADPHLNQKVGNDIISTYEVKDLYLLKIKDLSSGITIGININNSTDFKILLSELQWFNKNYSNIISFK